VPVNRSVKDDHIICLEDGKKFRSLRRHLMAHYNMSPDEYRRKWGLPADYPMVAPAYSRRRSELARAAGLGRKEQSEA
jgi:predicted transcriptional regulator